MLITPRDYQQFAEQSIFAYFTQNTGNPLVAMPTGTGKSIVIGSFVYNVMRTYAGQRIMVLTHVKELIAQNHEKLMSMWPQAPAGIYSAGLGRQDTWQPIIFGGIASVAKKAHLFGKIDLILIDECHLVNPQEEGNYRKFIEALKVTNPHLKIIGFTATPWRLGHGKITENGIFTDICCDMTSVEAFNWLIQQGYLLPLIPKRTKMELDTEGVHKRGGEFIAGELQTAVNKREITVAAIQEALDLGGNRNAWLIFCAGVEHAIDAAAILNEMGIPAAAVHGSMGDAERDRVLKDFKAGKYRAVTNNNVLTTGFDYPAIDLILMLRPTASAVLWVQMLGRGTRPLFVPGYDLTTLDGRQASIAASGKQNCLVLDFAGNTRRLGPINDPVVPPKKGEKGGTAPVRECEACGTYNHASARFCINCGAEFFIQTKLKAAASTMDLIRPGQMDLPVVEVFKVDHITYAPHMKLGSPPGIRVSYYCGLRMFNQWVLLEHPKVAGIARRWWRERTISGYIPEDTEDALSRTDDLRPATHIRVVVNKKYPEVLAACYDGTGFGTCAPTAAPSTEVTRTAIPTPGRARTTKFVSPLDPDADIPFTPAEVAAAARPAPPDWSDMDDDIPF